MLTVLSPAKTLDFKTPPKTETASQPAMLDHSRELVEVARKLSGPDLSALMKISPRLGTINRNRFADWETPFTPANAKQAVLAFKGDVYMGMDAESFSEKQFSFAQEHVRILSGLYGVLRPLDLIQPYRLEMGTKLENDRGKNLYAFWGSEVTEELNQQLAHMKSSTLVNLASNEYFKSVRPEKLNADIIAPTFLDKRGDQYKIISFYAKRARGVMTSWLVKNEVTEPADLMKYEAEGYRYSADLSTPQKPAFIRDAKPD